MLRRLLCRLLGHRWRVYPAYPDYLQSFRFRCSRSYTRREWRCTRCGCWQDVVEYPLRNWRHRAYQIRGEPGERASAMRQTLESPWYRPQYLPWLKFERFGGQND